MATFNFEAGIFQAIWRALDDKFEIASEFVAPIHGMEGVKQVIMRTYRLRSQNNLKLELHLTYYKRETEEDVTAVLMSPVAVCQTVAGYSRREAFRQHILQRSDFMTAAELDTEVSNLLELSINRLENYTCPILNVLNIDSLREKLLDDLGPEQVARLERTGKPLRNVLLSNSVDQSFWKSHYIRQFGAPAGTSTSAATDGPSISFRERYCNEMRRRRVAAMEAMARPVVYGGSTSTFHLPQPPPFHPPGPPNPQPFPPGPQPDQPWPPEGPPFAPPLRPRGPEGDPPDLPWRRPPGRGGGGGGGGYPDFGGGGGII